MHDTLHAEASVIYVKLRDAQRTRKDAEDAATTTSAGLRRAEITLENAIREVDAAAKKLDRKEPALAAQRTIFPAGMSPMIRPDGEAQLEVLPSLRVRIAPFTGKGDMADAMASLDSAEMQHRAALAAVNLAATEVGKRFAEEREARRAVREQLASAHGRLRDHYKTLPATAERFFLREKAPPQAKTKPPSPPAPAAMPA